LEEIIADPAPDATGRINRKTPLRKVKRKGGVTIRLEVWVKPGLGKLTINRENPFSLVTEASYTYVAIDQEGQKRAFPKPATQILS